MVSDFIYDQIVYIIYDFICDANCWYRTNQIILWIWLVISFMIKLFILFMISFVMLVAGTEQNKRTTSLRS